MVKEQFCSLFTRTLMLWFKVCLQFHIDMSRKESLEEFISMPVVSNNSTSCIPPSVSLSIRCNGAKFKEEAKIEEQFQTLEPWRSRKKFSRGAIGSSARRDFSC